MLNRKYVQLSIMASLLFPMSGFAADANTVVHPNQVATNQGKTPATEIADINERIAVLSARLAELEVESKIAQKRAEIDKTKNIDSGPNGSDNFIPTVAHIDGVDGKLKASLYMQGGALQSVRVGDTVGSWKIKDIKMDAVTLQKGKEVKRLGFGSYSSSMENPSNVNPSPATIN